MLLRRGVLIQLRCLLPLEVEINHRESDRVAIKHYTNYGDYSGRDWVSGFRQPPTIHLDFPLLHSGRYQLAIASHLLGIKLELIFAMHR